MLEMFFTVDSTWPWNVGIPDFGQFVGLAYQAKDIVFRFIIEYGSLRDFGPYLCNRSVFI